MKAPIALQRVDRFVARTTNWLYDHLRHLKSFEPAVMCRQLQHREEYPLLEAWATEGRKLINRIWRRVTRNSLYPYDYRQLRRFSPVLLHSHFGNVALGDFALREYLQVPWIVSFYGADIYQSRTEDGNETRYDELFNQVDMCLALGPVMAKRLRSLGCPHEKVMVHPLGVDVSTIECKLRRMQPGEPMRVLFAGTFREKKGLPYLVEAVALAREEGANIELILVGEPGGKPGDQEVEACIARKIQEHSIGSAVTRHRFLEFDRLMDLAYRAHVFVGPSITGTDGDSEGTPFVLQQMMASGMPVIATRHSDIPFIFGRHDDLLVEERNAPAIAARLLEYVRNPNQLAETGQQLGAHVREHFDVDQHAQRLSQIYSDFAK